MNLNMITDFGNNLDTSQKRRNSSDASFRSVLAAPPYTFTSLNPAMAGEFGLLSSLPPSWRVTVQNKSFKGKMTNKQIKNLLIEYPWN